jgi:hypothetical protein|tara:strand:+ start:23489 stop:24202 length:714 start_codon:yes stop_codon:yes gene_type:complete
MDLLDEVRETGIVRIIINYLSFFYHVDKNKHHIHHIKFKNVLSKINYNYMKNKKRRESDIMLLYILKDHGFINISYKECLTMSSFHVMDDIRNRLVNDQRQLNNYYNLVANYRNRNRRLYQPGIISQNLRNLFFDDEIFAPRLMYTRHRVQGSAFGCYIYGHDKRVNAVNKLENKLEKKRKIFLKKNYKRDITKENRDLLIRRIQSKLKSRKLKNLEKSKKIHKDLLKNKKTNRRYR